MITLLNKKNKDDIRQIDCQRKECNIKEILCHTTILQVIRPRVYHLAILQIVQLLETQPIAVDRNTKVTQIDRIINT